jgi:hypothetical protein
VPWSLGRTGQLSAQLALVHRVQQVADAHGRTAYAGPIRRSQTSGCVHAQDTSM